MKYSSTSIGHRWISAIMLGTSDTGVNKTDMALQGARI